MLAWIERITKRDKLPPEVDRYNVIRPYLPTEDDVQRWKHWAERIQCSNKEGHNR